MLLLSFRVRNRKPNNVIKYKNKIQKYLLSGCIILSSTDNYMSYYLAPSPIKHCSIYYNNKIIEMTEFGFRIITLEEFLLYKDMIMVFYYKSPTIMRKTLNYVFKYQNMAYGFFSNNEQYCFKILYDIYNEALGYKFKMQNFLPTFKIFNKNFINSNSFMLSENFFPACSIYKGFFISFI